jgi:hypothetical protein
MHNPTKVDEETRLKTYECINKEIAKKIEQEKQELVTKVECLTQIQYCLDKRLEDDKDWMIGDKKVKKVWTSSQYVNILASKDNKDYLLKIEIHPWEEDKSN